MFRHVSNVQLHKRLFSRKNKVYQARAKVGGKTMEVVVKQYTDAAGAKREYEILAGLHEAGLRVPQPYGCFGNMLVLEEIKGELLTDVVEKESVPVDTWTRELALWFHEFHRAQKINGMFKLKNDNNLRNFIFSEGQVFGLDFEQEEYGPRERDLGQVCVFIISDRPSFTNKKYGAVARFISYARLLDPGLSPHEIERCMNEELMHLLERRKGKNCPCMGR